MAEDRWSTFDPGRSGPEYRRRSDYGYDRLDGSAPAKSRPPEDRNFWSRARDEVQAWLGGPGADEGRHGQPPPGSQPGDRRVHDDLVGGADHLREPVSHRGRGPRGYRRPDQRIGEDVADRLTDDPYLDASDIQVDVREGAVRLSGRVDSEEARRRAERLAERVSGVARVWNQLEAHWR